MVIIGHDGEKLDEFAGVAQIIQLLTESLHFVFPTKRGSPQHSQSEPPLRITR
jgi:hypothetical protein